MGGRRDRLWRLAWNPPFDAPFIKHNGQAPCPCQKLHPTILMMKSAEDWLRNNPANPLDGTTERRILAEGEMCPDVIIIVRVGGKDPAQMGLAEDDDMIAEFAADRADQSLRMPVLPG